MSAQQTITFTPRELRELEADAARGDLRHLNGQPVHPWAMSVLALLSSASRGTPMRPALPLAGAGLAFESTVPPGAGQSSSAALLVGITLACNELFGWRIPRSESFLLADIARSGEHEDYSPFVRKGRAGYLDQIVVLTAREGMAVAVDHGNYSRVELVDLGAVEAHAYRNIVVLSGLTRALAETEYATRVDELSRLPAALNDILSRRRARWDPRSHVHQFTFEEWREASAELADAHPILARRARYVFEERERAARFPGALAGGRMDELIDLINASGLAMSMKGPYQISGYNRVPRGNQRIAALDQLRELVLRHAGPRSAARLIGGGGAGPLYALVPAAIHDRPAFAQAIVEEWHATTGLTAQVLADPPAGGAEIIWRPAAS